MISTALWLRIGGYAAAGAAVLLAYLWLTAHHDQRGYDRAMGEVAAKHLAMAEAQRKREIEDQIMADQEARHVQQKLNDLERERDAARADAGRVQRLYREAAERGRQALACAAGAGEGEPGSDPLGVFADMLIRADQRAEAVAGYADRLRIAGESCERQYDSMSR